MKNLIISQERFDAIEIHPCTEDGGIVEQCEPKDAQFWSVYIHLAKGGIQCIADCDTEAEAKQFAELLLTACQNYIPARSVFKFKLLKSALLFAKEQSEIETEDQYYVIKSGGFVYVETGAPFIRVSELLMAIFENGERIKVD